MKKTELISKEKLVATIAKKAGISEKKALVAYECVVAETPSFRKQALKTVTAKKEVLVKVPGKTVVKKVQLKRDKPIKSTITKEKIKKVVVTKKVPVEVIKKVPVIQKVEVIKEVLVPVEKVVEVIKEVEVVKEIIKKVTVPVVKKVQVIKKVEVIKKVPYPVEKIVEKIKEIEVIKEVPVPVEKIVEIVKEVEVIKEVPVEKIVEKIKEVQVIKEVPVEVIKEITLVREIPVIKEVEVVKEIPVEIIKEVEVVKQVDFATLSKMIAGMKTVEISKKVVGETRTKKEAKVVERRELKDGVKPSKVVAKPTAKATTTKTVAVKAKATKIKADLKKTTKVAKAKADDLTKIEGIGPKISSLLKADGINSFKALAGAKAENIKKILLKAGPRYQMHDPTTWPKQAKLAADGNWKALEKLQSELSGGK